MNKKEDDLRSHRKPQVLVFIEIDPTKKLNLQSFVTITQVF